MRYRLSSGFHLDGMERSKYVDQSTHKESLRRFTTFNDLYEASKENESLRMGHDQG